MKFKNLRNLFVLVLGLFVLVGCNQNTSGDVEDSEKIYEIGIIQYTEHDALNAGRQGFVDRLEELGYVDGENINIDYKNAQADQANLNSIGQQFKGKKDLILAIATPAAQTMANQEKDTPILFTAVTDPVMAKLVESLEVPGGNVSGTSDAMPAKYGVDLLIQAKPETQTIGVLYNSSEPNSQVQFEQVKEYAESKGLGVEGMTVATTNDVQGAITSLVEKVDGVYLPTDNTIASTIPTIGNVVKNAGVPTIGGDVAHIEGTLAAVGVDFYELGKLTADQADKILKTDLSPSELQVGFIENPSYKVNEDMAEALGIDLGSLEVGE